MKTTIGHCPYCTNTLFKEASFRDEADFETRCPHCRRPILVQVEKEIIIVVKPIIKMDMTKDPKDACGKPC